MKEEAKKKKMRAVVKDVKFATLVGMILSLMTIGLTLRYVKAETVGETDPLILNGFITLIFFFTAITRLLRARRMRLMGKPKSKYMMQRVYALAFLVCALMPYFFDYVKGPSPRNVAEPVMEWCGDVRQAIGVVFWGVLIAGRIVSIVRDHRLRKVIVNIMLILLLALTELVCFSICDLMAAMVSLVAMTLGDMFTVVFARIHMDALKRIIRKTYAAEIILGLLLMIFAFSYVLEFCENISYLDGLWYCFAIVTTIGFGDIAAQTHIGKLLSVILGVYGIVVVSLITSIIVNFYAEVKREPDDPEDLDLVPEPEELPETEELPGPGKEA